MDTKEKKRQLPRESAASAEHNSTLLLLLLPAAASVLREIIKQKKGEELGTRVIGWWWKWIDLHTAVFSLLLFLFVRTLVGVDGTWCGRAIHFISYATHYRRRRRDATESWELTLISSSFLHPFFFSPGAPPPPPPQTRNSAIPQSYKAPSAHTQLDIISTRPRLWSDCLPRSLSLTL